jgi:hypothetical protein
MCDDRENTIIICGIETPRHSLLLFIWSYLIISLAADKYYNGSQDVTAHEKYAAEIR